MRYAIFFAAMSLAVASCSDHDEPVADVYSQVAEITDGATTSQKIAYDEYGRVVSYTVSWPYSSVTSSYSYPSENVIKIYTEYVFGASGLDEIRKYEAELYLENGRATQCDGIFSTNEIGGGAWMQKKYRHEFTYTADNHLNVVKWTEWNKRGDDWAYDRPWTWENYYKWDNGNLTEVEDYSGGSRPAYTYRYSYDTTVGVQNVIPVHLGSYQYYPLQLKGCFGTMSRNLVTGEEMTATNSPSSSTEYTYEIAKDKVTAYTETQNGESAVFAVSWTE